MKFNYQTRTKTGEIRSGVIEASSKEAALNLLQKYGLFVTILEEVRGGPIYAKRIKIFERVSTKELFIFSQQLSVMFMSKVPLVESLATLANQIKNPDFREKIIKISEEVEAGTSFSSALSKYPKVFSPFYVAMVKAGEVSGKLSESLSYLAKHLEREYILSGKIMGAMIYPAVIALVAIVVFILMILVVLPPLIEVLESTVKELPLATKIIINFASFSKSWGWAIALLVIALVASIFRYYKTREGKRLFDRFSLKLPLFGNLSKMIYLSRFAENLSTLISSGMPITQSLEITENIIGNTIYKRIIFETREQVKKGEAISMVLSSYPEFFPPVFNQMVLVGERTGTLDKTLMNLVDFYRQEVDRTVNNMIGILEPVIIVFLGAAIGGLVISILLPLYQSLSL